MNDKFRELEGKTETKSAAAPGEEMSWCVTLAADWAILHMIAQLK